MKSKPKKRNVKMKSSRKLVTCCAVAGVLVVSLLVTLFFEIRGQSVVNSNSPVAQLFGITSESDNADRTNSENYSKSGAVTASDSENTEDSDNNTSSSEDSPVSDSESDSGTGSNADSDVNSNSDSNGSDSNSDSKSGVGSEKASEDGTEANLDYSEHSFFGRSSTNMAQSGDMAWSSGLIFYCDEGIVYRYDIDSGKSAAFDMGQYVNVIGSLVYYVSVEDTICCSELGGKSVDEFTPILAEDEKIIDFLAADGYYLYQTYDSDEDSVNLYVYSTEDETLINAFAQVTNFMCGGSDSGIVYIGTEEGLIIIFDLKTCTYTEIIVSTEKPYLRGYDEATGIVYFTDYESSLTTGYYTLDSSGNISCDTRYADSEFGITRDIAFWNGTLYLLCSGEADDLTGNAENAGSSGYSGSSGNAESIDENKEPDFTLYYRIYDISGNTPLLVAEEFPCFFCSVSPSGETVYAYDGTSLNLKTGKINSEPWEFG